MPRLKKPLYAILIIVILSILIPNKIGNNLKGFVFNILSPVLTITSESTNWTHTRLSNIKNLGTLHKENAVLKERVIYLEQQVLDLAAAAKENESLKAELGITNRPSADLTVAANIISRSSNNVLGEALIDQGSSASIEVGQAVMAKGVLVGVIKEVFTNNSLVSLVNSPTTHIQALLTDSESLGIISGSPTGLKLTEIDQGIEIKEGEIVQSSGLGGTIPRGLLIGEVDRVISDASSSQQEALIRTSINFDQLQLVFVILRTPPL